MLRQWFTRHAVARHDPPVELVLDVDSTDDPTHGQQALSFFNVGRSRFLWTLDRKELTGVRDGDDGATGRETA